MSNSIRMFARLLETELLQADSRSILVPARVLQRVIRFDCRLSTLDWASPHSDCYAISRERLLDYTSRYEYHLVLDRELPETLLLFPEPDSDSFAGRPFSDWAREYWRMLFHLRVHLEYRQLAASHKLGNDRLLERMRSIGEVAFAEARSVLQAEERLLPPSNYQSIYVEFAATFLELWYFSPELMAAYFPGLRDAQRIANLLSGDLDHAELLRITRLASAVASSPNADDEASHAPNASSARVNAAVAPLVVHERRFRRLAARAARMDRLGNVLQAAILRREATQCAPAALRNETQIEAEATLARFAARFAKAFGLDETQTELVAAALRPVLTRADAGYQQIESRLLYELQKACLEREGEVYAANPWRWLATAGRTRFRRSLPLLRDVLVIRSLNKARQKLRVLSLDSGEEHALLAVVETMVERTQQELRRRVQPIIESAFHEEGCRPGSVVERVALHKVVQELLDRVVDKGQSSMGQLRDAISQSNFKLPDLESLEDLVRGDPLLRIDRRMAATLDGVYHRGPVYLRMSHRLSSLAFGTRLGRIITRYAVLPFGGAYLILESFQHLLHFLFPRVEILSAGAGEAVGGSASFPLTTFSFVLILGTFLLLLIEKPEFRGWFLHLSSKIGNALVYLVRDLPEFLLKMPWIRQLIESPTYIAFVNYVFKPLAITAGGVLLIDRIGHWLPERQIVSEHQMAVVPNLFRQWAWRIVAFLVVNLFLNSPLGRHLDAVVMDHIRRGWRELRLKVFAAAFRFIIDLFQTMLRTIEQVIYSVDDLLRFRSGEGPLVITGKSVLGLVWSVVSYVFRIYVTLLIEPQLNPIKHFPVVTVSHKLILPFSIQLTNLLSTPLMPMGTLLAKTIAGTTVFLLPGVFGFLAWELKENWRLYAANRGPRLTPVPIGGHGETMARLLRPGFHSGTIPKLFAKLRRVFRVARPTEYRRGVIQVDEKLRHVERSIEVFIEREAIALLRELPAWRDLPLTIDSVKIASNAIEIRVIRGGSDEGELSLRIADLGGWLVARVASWGWASRLDQNRRRELQVAIRGIYRYAGVELIWDDLADGLGLSAEPYWYDFNRDGLQVWSQERFEPSIQYKLRDMGATQSLSPQPKFVTAPRAADLTSIIFSQTSDDWAAWVAAWDEFALAGSAGPLTAPSATNGNG